MKIGFIFVLFKTPEEELNRLTREIIDLGAENYRIYFVDNTGKRRGFAAGVNEGIRLAEKDRCDLYIVGNPDIFLAGIKIKDLLAGGKKFDLWGLAMKQQGRIFYGGEIDPWRLTGGLISLKPKTRFQEVDWISGSLMLIKKETAGKIGYFSEEYFMYYEDTDYCYRAKKAGLKVGIDSRTIYEHFETSTGNPEKIKFLENGKKIFFSKYSTFRQKIYGLLRTPKTLTEKLGENNNPFTNLILGNRTVSDVSRGKFIINFGSLNASSLINKILNFFLFIFLIRFLSPQGYGIYTLVWAQVSIFSPIVDLGTTSYGIIDLPNEQKRKFIPLFNLRLMVAILVFFLTVLTGYFMFRGNQRLVMYIILTSFVIISNVFSGSYLIKNAVEGKLFNSSYVSIIFNTGLVLVLILSSVFFHSLALIFLLTFIFYNLYSFVNYFLIKKDFSDLTFKFEIKIWKNFLQKSYVYVLIGFLASLYFKIDVFLLQFYKGSGDVGIYSAGYKFFEGLMFIAASYNISRAPMLAGFVKKGKLILLAVVKKDIFFLAVTGLSVAVCGFFLSPLILPLFLKGSYKESITVVRLVLFALPLILVSSVFLNAIYVLKKAVLIIPVFLFQVLNNFVLNIVFIPKYSYIASSYITIFSELLNVIILAVIFKSLIKKANENIA